MVFINDRTQYVHKNLTLNLVFSSKYKNNVGLWLKKLWIYICNGKWQIWHQILIELGIQVRCHQISHFAIRPNARLITNFGNFVFGFFHYFGCVIFFTLNFRFACLALLSKKVNKLLCNILVTTTTTQRSN